MKKKTICIYSYWICISVTKYHQKTFYRTLEEQWRVIGEAILPEI